MTARRVLALVLAASAMGVVLPTVADAASVAYVDNGEVWVSNLDGSRKIKLADPVVNSDGDTETWLDVAASDSGRIVAVRNKPGRNGQFNWFKIWEPDLSSTVEGPLNAKSGWTIYIYPLSLDITADGSTLVYGFSNSGSCCPISYARGTYVRPATNSVFDPIDIPGQTWPTLNGGRVVSASGSTVSIQKPGTTYGYRPEDFDPWFTLNPPANTDLHRTDTAANGKVVAFELETRDPGSSNVTAGTVSLAPIGSLDPAALPDFAKGCDVASAGPAAEVSLGQDATRFAWVDGGGLKVAGIPDFSGVDACTLTAPAVVISATGRHPSIRPTDLPAPASTPPPGGTTTTPGGTTTTPGGTTPPPGTTTAPLAATLPTRATVAALKGTGLAVKVTVKQAGRVTAKGSVPGTRVGRRSKTPVVVATGAATATKAGTITIKLKLSKAFRKRAKKLKGTKLTVRITQGTRTVTRTLTLR